MKRWRSWWRYSDTSQKVAGSIPDGVSGIFYCNSPFESVSNKNEYQEYFLGVKATGAYVWQPYLEI